MQKIKIRLPATITNLGPGLGSLGLAVGLYTTVEISGREDDQLLLEMTGQGAAQSIEPLKHPVVLAMGRFFQQLEQAQSGINIRIDNQIPLHSGLGAEAAFTLAGVIGANNLTGMHYKRDELLEIAANIRQPDAVVAALLGGLTMSLLEEDELIYQALPVKPMQLIVATPEVDDFSVPELPQQITREDALHSLTRLPLLIEALRQGDVRLLVRVLHDPLLQPLVAARIPGYGHVAEIARNSGALAVAPCGYGPTVLALAEKSHKRIAEDMALAFKSIGIEAQSWVLPVDTQGVVISAVQSR